MEVGVIEGTYLAWLPESRTVAKRLRSMLAGLVVSERLGHGSWPSILKAERCRACGVGCFET